MAPRFVSASSAALVAALLVTGPTSAQTGPLRLGRLFQDGMVLQRGARVPVWGWAAPGASVTVSLGGRTARAVAGADSAWSVDFPALPAGGPHALRVDAGGARVDVADVLVGDVWIASGQSNMEWPLAQATGGREAIFAARDPQLREFAVPHSWADDPAKDLQGGRWASADPAHAGAFSAVGYWFARDLRASTGVPVGIIHTSWGGANVETWMSRPALGISDSAWAAMMQADRDRVAALRESLRARIGGLPSADAGMEGVRAVWADPALDESGWTDLPVPGYWEQNGYEGLDGAAWYRTAFTLTEDEARQGVRISLGTIDDDDVTWVNGIEAGRTSGYSLPRLYTVPASALRAGHNVLVVRVGDGAGNGGPYGAADRFYVETSAGRKSLAGTWKFRVGAVNLGTDGQRINKVPSYLYNRMIHPIVRYPVKGVIWYQGESNANNDQQAAAYAPLFSGLIRDWRRAWNDADLPFLWVQLPNFGAADSVPPRTAGWAILRESQSAALALPNTGQVIAIDVGDAADLHPRDKQPVGQRLALVARRVAYGERVADRGPTYRRHSVGDGRVTVEFDHADGLTARGTLGAFAIAGADRRWVWAQARIEGNRVVVWSPEVPEPVAVRYAWSNGPVNATLYNGAGLPAAPFRTDEW
ncbi:sialate O-acetylesterase [Longimicrobium sp.]|uniref:sialate O-acetylesterase n=1 Tax=Longimicrobium sp. TaxID=2029185 RepID=UPI002E360326|nr:sialate O-acetylesterase [Longimicrobium sp.]HEX6041901.1 sialate O-acetylesterase [Longimicrobium sp.]